LDPIILGEQNSSSRFAEIFRTTPPWLLQFTRTVLDAWILKFHLPQMRPHSNWGTEGLSDAEHWPFLPSGVLTAGEPIPDKDVRQLVVAVQSIVPPAGHVPNIVDQLAGVANDSSRDDRTTLDDIAVALSLGEKPSEEWSAYEKRRMRQLVRTMSRDD
jgi:hypothetical protein